MKQTSLFLMFSPEEQFRFDRLLRKSGQSRGKRPESNTGGQDDPVEEGEKNGERHSDFEFYSNSCY